MTMIKDIINHKNAYGIQTFVVVDEYPVFKYEKKGNLLIAEHDGFFKFYKYDRPSKMFQAFGGREFDIPLVNGEIIKANGQWWDAFPRDYAHLLYSLGVASEENLSNCYVFIGLKVDKELVDDWLKNNKPSNNYYKYDPKSKEYKKNLIESKFGDI